MTMNEFIDIALEWNNNICDWIKKVESGKIELEKPDYTKILKGGKQDVLQSRKRRKNF